jgi:hypothetical protein
MSEPGTTARALLRTLDRELHREDIDALSADERRELHSLLLHWQELTQLRLERTEARHG